MPITFSIVEDNRRVRESYVALLSRAPGLQFLSAHATGEIAVREIPREKPDVALVDINLPGMSGIECVAKLKAGLPALKILMLTRSEESDVIFKALRAGASGYLLKKTSSAELIRSIEEVHGGGAPMSMPIARKVVEHFHQITHPASEVEKLTSRENEILTLLAKGFYYKEIADQLGITLNTVRTHLHAIYDKLHVQSRTEATLKFLGQD